MSHVATVLKQCAAWLAWQRTPGPTDILVAFTIEPHFDISPLNQHMRPLERFVVIMYRKGCGLHGINEANEMK